MAVGFSAAGFLNGSSTSQASFTFNVATTGCRCLVVFAHTIAAAPLDTSVTANGVAMTLVPGSLAADTVTEPGCVRAYFLDNVAQLAACAVVVNRTNNATAMGGSAASFTALGACEVYTPGIVLLQEDGAYAVQSVDDGSPGTNSYRVAAAYYGGATPAPAGTGSSLQTSFDFTAFGISMVVENTAGQGARNVGFLQATSDDRAAVHFAVRETPAATAKAFPFQPRTHPRTSPQLRR